ncbi:MAG: hypothetical protein WDM89_12195 [Rhizomicrobium sp.]
MLTRQSKIVETRALRQMATSRVIPPPFFQGAAMRSAARSTRIMFCSLQSQRTL